MSRLKSTPASPTVQAARNAVLTALRAFDDKLTASELLAVLSYTVGQAVALQDQTTMTPDEAMELVSANVQAGNRDAIHELLGSPQGRA